MKNSKKNIYSQEYLRWKKQLVALKHNDLYTVKELAKEARDYFMLRKTGSVQLRLS